MYGPRMTWIGARLAPWTAINQTYGNPGYCLTLRISYGGIIQDTNQLHHPAYPIVQQVHAAWPSAVWYSHAWVKGRSALWSRSPAEVPAVKPFALVCIC